MVDLQANGQVAGDEASCRHMVKLQAHGRVAAERCILCLNFWLVAKLQDNLQVAGE